jgi:hypothetical protein
VEAVEVLRHLAPDRAVQVATAKCSGRKLSAVQQLVQVEVEAQVVIPVMVVPAVFMAEVEAAAAHQAAPVVTAHKELL